MIQTPFIDQTKYIFCLACGQGRSAVSHLQVGAETAWYCDECGVRFSVRVISADQVETIPSLTERKVKTLVTLRSDAPVTLIVEGMRLENDSKPDDWENDSFFYDEHTCPTNYLTEVVKVIAEDGDEDPHGIFAYVKTEPWRDLEKE